MWNNLKIRSSSSIFFPIYSGCDRFARVFRNRVSTVFLPFPSRRDGGSLSIRRLLRPTAAAGMKSKSRLGLRFHCLSTGLASYTSAASF